MLHGGLTRNEEEVSFWHDFIRARRRTAFTLVEMLVAAALILLMMWIIATAFTKGLEAFSTLKTAGDMQEKLRGKRPSSAAT